MPLKQEMDRNLLRKVFIMFYLPDWRWYLALFSVIAGILALYTELPGKLEHLSDLAFTGDPSFSLLPASMDVFFLVGGIIFLSILKRTLLRYIMRARVLSRVQSFLVRRVAAFPLDYFSKRSPGDLLSIMTNIAISAADGMMMMLEPLIIALQSFCLALLMCFISLRLSLAILMLLATYFIVLYLLRKRQAHLYSRLAASQRALSALAADVHRGFPEIKQNALESVFEQRFVAAAQTHWANFNVWFKTLLASGDVSEYIGVFLPALALFAAAVSAPGQTSQAEFISLYTLAVILTGLLTSLNQAGFSSASGLQAWRELMELVEEETEPADGLKPEGYDIAWVDVTKKMRGKVVLQDVSLSVAEGEKIMICGRSGEGKSTVLRMLPGLLMPDSGAAYLGGVPTHAADPKTLRARTAFVTQDPYLFETTLRENLTYGSVVDDAKLEEAIRLAQLEDFVAALPEGLETRLGPDGAKVSGGEKARIALVRALLAGPDILVLDEATASLDSETEERIYRRLLAVDYTVIGVTHRLSTLKLFPRIVVLADGRFVLDGSAQELADSETFQELFAFQMNNSESGSKMRPQRPDE